MQGNVRTISAQCLALERILELGVLFLSRVARAREEKAKSEIEISIAAIAAILLPKVRNGIWDRILNVLNLKYERLVHNSAKVVPCEFFSNLMGPHRTFCCTR